jgi:hypothetical protein
MAECDGTSATIAVAKKRRSGGGGAGEGLFRLFVLALDMIQIKTIILST